jgi:PAS/PAC sensor hybrid histidine kinase (EC 2.7.13.3)
VEHSGTGVTVTIGDFTDGFYVEDDGPGFPADERADVFEAGYSPGKNGTGFGLTVVKQIAEAHGWEPRVSDPTGSGARLEIANISSTEPAAHQ